MMVNPPSQDGPSSAAGFTLGAHLIAPGERRTVTLPVSLLSDHTPVGLAVHVIHGERPGPTVFVSAAIHGDEIIGVEIVRRLLKVANLDRLRGTLLAIPVVNSFGFINRSRYLPDRRDLNRCFPGSAKGSLADRLAHLFVTEILDRSDVGIDLHSAAIHRTNLPQIRISPKREETTALAHAFGAPLILSSSLRDGSLREMAWQRDVDLLLFEGGEGLRFDELSARVGVAGILRVMHHLDMIPGDDIEPPEEQSVMAKKSAWLRSPAGGLLRAYKTTGDHVAAGEELGIISDPFGEVDAPVLSASPGLIIGRTNMPMVNEGDALFHVASVADPEDAAATVDGLATQLEDAPLFDEDEII